MRCRSVDEKPYYDACGLVSNNQVGGPQSLRQQFPRLYIIQLIPSLDFNGHLTWRRTLALITTRKNGVSPIHALLVMLSHAESDWGMGSQTSKKTMPCWVRRPSDLGDLMQRSPDQLKEERMFTNLCHIDHLVISYLYDTIGHIPWDISFADWEGLPW